MWNFSADRGGALRSAARPHVGPSARAAAPTAALLAGATTLLHGTTLARGRRTGASGRLRGRVLDVSVRDMTSRGSPPRRPQ